MVDDIFKDCESCPNQGKLKMKDGWIFTFCNRGILKGKRKCTTEQRTEMTFEEMDESYRRERREIEKDLRDGRR